MTYAEELLQEGFEKGLKLAREEVMLTNRQGILIRQLSRRFSLSANERHQIESCDDRDALDAALDEFAVTTTKESVLAKLP